MHSAPALTLANSVGNYYRVARMTVKNAWADAPIVFDVLHRGAPAMPYKLIIKLSPVAVIQDTTVQSFVQNISATPIFHNNITLYRPYIHTFAPGVFDLYLPCCSTNDSPTITDFARIPYLIDSRLSIEWLFDLYASLPVGGVYATQHGSVVSYSTTEQLTEEIWHDGKSIYRRVFTGTITAAAGADAGATLLSSVAEVVSKEGMWRYSNNELNYLSLPGNEGANLYGYFHHSKPNGAVSFTTRSGIARTNAPYTIKLKYTKP